MLNIPIPYTSLTLVRYYDNCMLVGSGILGNLPIFHKNTLNHIWKHIPEDLQKQNRIYVLIDAKFKMCSIALQLWHKTTVVSNIHSITPNTNRLNIKQWKPKQLG